MVTFTNTDGVLSAPVVTTAGSGYGTAAFTWAPADGAGSGALVTITPANTDQAYNYTPSQVQFLQWFLAVDYQALGAVLQGTQRVNTATAVTLGSGGSGWVVGNYAFVTQAGSVGILVQVTAASGGVATAIALVNGGIGALVASGLARAAATGSGTGLTVNVTTVGGYNFTANTFSMVGWGF